MAVFSNYREKAVNCEKFKLKAICFREQQRIMKHCLHQHIRVSSQNKITKIGLHKVVRKVN